ncbi:hypothetical protein sce1543 [Sorangium cellulosum So ce56]|uniref:Uncharacterized protein n=1 Tax=Sorangium cellulosum (strain So ce56) TaxID=448385 RepID=A9FCV8_SORC5|nr:hypothetical protein sce1543 [Sorangium cellulosum So ce56]
MKAGVSSIACEFTRQPAALPALHLRSAGFGGRAGRR